jgi:hypothetical protein
LALAALIYVLVRAPERVITPNSGAASLLDVFQIPRMWAIFALVTVNYIAASSMHGI